MRNGKVVVEEQPETETYKRKVAHVQMEQELDRIFAITSIYSKDQYGESSNRTPMLCSTFEKAVDMVEGNGDCLWEHLYDLVVIEGVRMNCVYGSAPMGGFEKEQYWYVWDMDMMCYRPIECPELYEGTFGIGVG